jgi:hypothetical protein
MKRIYITLAVLFIGMIGMAYLYFSNLKTATNANDLSLNTITSNSALVFSFESDKSFYEILSGQELFQNILGETKAKQFKLLKDNLATVPEISTVINGQKIYIGFLASGTNNEINFLISTQLKPNINTEKILNNNKLLTKKDKNTYQLKFTDSTTCYIGIKDMLVVLSNDLNVIKNCLKEPKQSTNEFANYIKANSIFNKNTLASLYINFNKIPLLLKNILNTNINGELNLFNKQNTFVALNYNFSKEKILFNGITDIKSNNSYYKLFEKIPEQKITIRNILPQKTANYTIFAVSDYANWHKDLTQLMVKNKEDEKISKAISSINQKYRLDLNQIFPKYFKDQIITFQLNTGEKLGAISLNNGEKVNQLLLDLSTAYTPEIRVFKENNVCYAYFGEPFKKFERPFYTIIDNYLVIANNASSIQVFLNSYKNDQLLTNDENFQDFSNQISSKATISFYINNKNTNDIFGRNLKQPYYKQYRSVNGLKKFEMFSYQLSGDKGRFLSNILLYKKPDKTISIDTLVMAN